MKKLIFASFFLFAIVAIAVWILVLDPSQGKKVKALVMAPSRIDVIMPDAEAGNARAQSELGVYYLKGEGVKQDFHKAYNWLQKAADKGDLTAMHALGGMFVKGQGIRQDYFKAAKWFKLAATLGGHAPSQFAIGELYFKGQGVEHDYAKAIAFYNRAAQKGHPGAQYLMGAMYSEGWGVKKDLIESYKWYTVAATKADEAKAINPRYDPVEGRQRIAGNMNDYQIKEGEKRAKALLAKLR